MKGEAVTTYCWSERIGRSKRSMIVLGVFGILLYWGRSLRGKVGNNTKGTR